MRNRSVRRLFVTVLKCGSYFVLKRRCLLLLSVLVLPIVLLFLIWVKRFSSCSQQVVEHAVLNLCQLYSSGNIDGNLCDDLCVFHTLDVGKCQPYHFGKEIVSKGTWNGIEVVVKASYAELLSYEESSGFSYSIFEEIDLEDFIIMIYNKLQHSFSINIRNKDFDMLQALWPWNFTVASHNFSDKKLSTMKTMWTLLQQDEYVIFKLYESTELFPKLFGVCGHFYVTEFVPLLSDSWESSQESKTHQRNAALKLLNMVVDLQERLHEPVHLCDVKESHFGFDEDFNVKILDADAIFFHSTLNTLLMNTSCSVDKDCSFWDCKATCLTNKRHCDSVANNNFQVICEKIFLAKGIPLLHNTGQLAVMIQEWEEAYDLVKKCNTLSSLYSDFDSYSRQSLVIYKNLYDVLRH